MDRLINDLGPSVSDIDPDLFAHIASAYYRGGLKPEHETFKLIQSGRYPDAAEEFLRNKEYERLKALNPEDGVVRRMDEMADFLRTYKPTISSESLASGYKRGGKIRDAYGRSYI